MPCSPSIVPPDSDQDIYLVLDQFGDDVADELRERCADRGETPASLLEFLERYDSGRPMQLLLPIATFDESKHH